MYCILCVMFLKRRPREGELACCHNSTKLRGLNDHLRSKSRRVVAAPVIWQKVSTLGVVRPWHSEGMEIVQGQFEFVLDEVSSRRVSPF